MILECWVSLEELALPVRLEPQVVKVQRETLDSQDLLEPLVALGSRDFKDQLATLANPEISEALES